MRVARAIAGSAPRSCPRLPHRSTKSFVIGVLTVPRIYAYDPLVRSGRGRRREASRLTGTDAVPAGSAKRRSGFRAATGLHSQALRPAARSWLTGVAGPRTGSVARTPCNDTAVARREAPARFERSVRPTERSVAPHRRATPSALQPREGEGRLTRGRSKKTGDDSWPSAKLRVPPPGALARATLPRAEVGCFRLRPLLECRTRVDPSSDAGEGEAAEVTLSRPSS